MKDHQHKFVPGIVEHGGGQRGRGAQRGWGRGLGLLAVVSAVACGANHGEMEGARMALSTAGSQAVEVQSGPRTVTLITGDRVMVSGKNAEAVSILPAAGRAGIRFTSKRVPAGPGQPPHLLVMPEDALPLLAEGKVDSRLFDVSLLLEFKYDDAHRDSLPLIMTYGPTRGAKLAVSARSPSGATVRQDLPSINGIAATARKDRVQEVWAAVVGGAATGAKARAMAGEAMGKVWLDGLRWPVLDRSVPQIGAPVAWALGYDGSGVVVAVLDTGVDTSHPDLVDRVIASRNFTDDPDLDQRGHGTHVASTIAGTGMASSGRYRGVAAGASLVSGKVCQTHGCPESSMIAGMEWAAGEAGARIVNLSIGGPDEPGIDPLEEAVNTLTAQYGTLFVISAGNSGDQLETVASPGSAEAALTVGAVDRDDEVASFSSRGLVVGDQALKPDITAPGVEIVAARAAGTQLGQLVGDLYVTSSGTSMAAPHVAGVAALLLQQHPSWGAAEVKAALMGSARYNLRFNPADQGAGRVDVASAVVTSIIADKPSLSFGLAPRPRDDDEPITRTVTYRNLGPATQLQLQLDVSGPDGAAAPADMFVVTPTSASLPEGGTVTVQVTANTRIAGPDGIYGGRLLASTPAGRTLSVPLVVNCGMESYDLTLRHIERAGMSGRIFVSFVVGADRPVWRLVSGVIGADDVDVTLRLPAGRYIVDTNFIGDDGDYITVTWLVAPNQQVAADRVLVMDASLASTINVKPPRSGLVTNLATFSYSVPTTSGGFESTLGFTGESIVFDVGELGPPEPTLSSLLHAQWLDLAASPEGFYAAGWAEQGRMPTGPVKTMDQRQASIVHAHYAAPLLSQESPPLTTYLLSGPWVPGMLGVSLAGPAAQLPYQRTEYYYSEGKDMGWINQLSLSDEVETTFDLGLGLVRYCPRRTYSAHFNRPPFSVLTPEHDDVQVWAYRQGDTLSLQVPIYSDRDGHAGTISGEGNLVLYRNGEKLDESGYNYGGEFDVPPEPDDYRLELSTSQSLFELTTREQVVWTFRSAHVDEGQREPLPLLAVRFTPDLNERGEALRSPRFRLPLSVSSHSQRASLRIGIPSAEVSYDDGATWAKARVERSGQQWHAILSHPARADYVSLRLGASDCAGNTVQQTVIRAYALAGHN